MHLEKLTDKNTGEVMAGFFVRASDGKVLAIGATGSFLVMKAKRYEHDLPLVAKIERLAGLQARHNQRS